MNGIKIIVILVGVVLGSTLQANKDYELFLEANQACKVGRYAQAINLYNQMNIQSGAVLYNTGYAQYGLGNYDTALVAWRQAERKTSGEVFKKVRVGVTQALNKLGEDQDSWLYQMLLRMQAGLWVGTVQCLIILLASVWLFLMFGSSSIQLNFTRRLKIVRVLIVVLLLLCLATLGAYYYCQGYFGGTWAVVTKSQQVLVMPNLNAHSVGNVNSGVLVKLVDENDAWCKMHYPRAKGWIQRDAVHPIKSA